MTRPSATPGGQWRPFRKSGVNVVVRPGVVPPPSHVTWVPAEAATTPTSWYRPAQVWIDNGSLHSSLWLDVGVDGRQSFDAFVIPVEEPRPNLLDTFLGLESSDEVLEFAQRWGCLGRCSCGRMGHQSWLDAMHEAHREVDEEPARVESFERGDVRTYLCRFSESIDTWFELQDRFAAFFRLFDGVGGTQSGSRGAEAAKRFGRSWEGSADFRRSQVESVMNELRRLGEVEPSFTFESDGVRQDLRPARSLLGWLAFRTLQSAGSVGEPLRMCANCREIFEYGRNREYCDKPECKKASRRNASRRYRERKKSAR